MVTKLLGDPTYFPIEFRRWLKDFFDNSDITISPGQIEGGGAGGGTNNPSLLPAGIILPYGGTGFGRDCLLCNGVAYSRTDYPDLFDAIGVNWGNGDGSTTFNVPDLRARALYGIGTTTPSSPGQTDGKGLSNRGGPVHHHDLNFNSGQGGAHGHSGSVTGGGSHQHGYDALKGSVQIQQGTQGGYIGVGDNTVGSYGTSGSGDHSHGCSVGAASPSTHQHQVQGSTAEGYDTKPSFAGVQYVITTGRSSAT